MPGYCFPKRGSGRRRGLPDSERHVGNYRSGNRPERPSLPAVGPSTTPDTFRSLNLAQVQPEHCLRSLKASVSRAPAELLPVKPLVELNMVDPEVH